MFLLLFAIFLFFVKISQNRNVSSGVFSSSSSCHSIDEVSSVIHRNYLFKLQYIGNDSLCGYEFNDNAWTLKADAQRREQEYRYAKRNRALVIAGTSLFLTPTPANFAFPSNKTKK